MWSKLRKIDRRRVSFRLTVWYAAFLAGSFAMAFTVLDHNLVHSLRKAETEIIKSKLKELVTEYGRGDLADIRHDYGDKRSGQFFVRIADAQNQTLFVHFVDPDDEAVLEVLEAHSNNQWAHIPLHDTEMQIGVTRGRNGEFFQVGRNTKRQQLFMDHFHDEAAAVLLPMLLFGLGGGAFLAYRALEPLHRLNATARKIIETGDVSARLREARNPGELRDLVISFNQMLDRIENLIQGMRNAIDNVAHDVRTPLTRLRGMAELALRNPTDPALANEALADCVEEADRIMMLLNALMDISEIETGAARLVLQATDFPALVREAAEIYGEIAEEKGVALEINTPAGFLVNGDPSRLRQAVANLVDNAIKYTPRGGWVRVSAEISGGEALCVVQDSGPGIPADEITRIWTRLYRGDASRSQRGLGLGLSLVKVTMDAHQGSAEVKSEPGEGSQFTLRLPCGRS